MEKIKPLFNIFFGIIFLSCNCPNIKSIEVDTNSVSSDIEIGNQQYSRDTIPEFFPKNPMVELISIIFNDVNIQNHKLIDYSNILDKHPSTHLLNSLVIDESYIDSIIIVNQTELVKDTNGNIIFFGFPSIVSFHIKNEKHLKNIENSLWSLISEPIETKSTGVYISTKSGLFICSTENLICVVFINTCKAKAYSNLKKNIESLNFKSIIGVKCGGVPERIK